MKKILLLICLFFIPKVQALKITTSLEYPLTVMQGEEFVITLYAISGDTIFEDIELGDVIQSYFDYDRKVFSFESLNTSFKFAYDPELDQVDTALTDLVIPEVTEKTKLWTAYFKVNKDAKIGETKIFNQSVTILEKETEKVEEKENNNYYFLYGIILGLIATVGVVTIYEHKKD